MKKNQPDSTVLRFMIQPQDDATLRDFCTRTKTTYSAFVRECVLKVAREPNKWCPSDFPEQRLIYGKLSKQAISILITRHERKDLIALAATFGIKDSRVFSRMLRGSISIECQKLRAGHLGE